MRVPQATPASSAPRPGIWPAAAKPVVAAGGGLNVELPFKLPGDSGVAGLPIPGLPLPGLKLGFKVNDAGHVLVSASMLGYTPFTVDLDPDYALAGGYGKRIEADMRDPAKTVLSGDVSYHGIPVAVPPLDVSATDFAKAFSWLSAKVVEPNNIHLDGRYRTKNEGLQFHAEAKSTKLASGVYEFDIRNLRLGSWNVPIPSFLASFCAWFMLKVMRGMDGISMAGFGKMRVDLRAAARSVQGGQQA